jgi:hypothetical protein
MCLGHARKRQRFWIALTRPRYRRGDVSQLSAGCSSSSLIPESAFDVRIEVLALGWSGHQCCVDSDRYFKIPIDPASLMKPELKYERLLIVADRSQIARNYAFSCHRDSHCNQATSGQIRSFAAKCRRACCRITSADVPYHLTCDKLPPC